MNKLNQIVIVQCSQIDATYLVGKGIPIQKLSLCIMVDNRIANAIKWHQWMGYLNGYTKYDTTK
jgi:hypothetical protein